jgi:hypothetical protein
MSILKKIGIAFLIAVFTGLFGFFLGTKQADGSFIQWKTLGKPSDTIVKIVRVTIDSVIVETTSNKKYSCNISTQNECWKEVVSVPAENTNCVPPRDLPKPLTSVVEIQQSSFLTPGGMTESAYALHEDGNIYVWHGNRGAIEGAWMIYLFSSIAGAVVGFIGTIIFFLVRWLIKLS